MTTKTKIPTGDSREDIKKSCWILWADCPIFPIQQDCFSACKDTTILIINTLNHEKNIISYNSCSRSRFL